MKHCGTQELETERLVLRRLSIDDSFREDALRLDIWLDEAGNPTKADISCKEQRYLSMVVQNFRTESEPEA